MSRSVVYPQRLTSPAAAASQPTFGGPSVAPAAPRPSLSVAPPDAYVDKLVKFVPAEVVAFFAPIASLLQERPPLLVIAAAMALFATPAYLWQAARRLPAEQRPPIHNYVLSSLAFVVWALATSRLGTLAGLDSVSAAFILGVSVFLIPLVDSLLARVPVDRAP